MGKKVSDFKETCEIKGINIIVKGELKQGEYYTEINYTLPYETATRKAKLYLSGSGKNKLKRKIINHLSSRIK